MQRHCDDEWETTFNRKAAERFDETLFAWEPAF